jgi:hypothetical protein
MISDTILVHWVSFSSAVELAEITIVIFVDHAVPRLAM